MLLKQFNNIMPKYGTIICSTHNLTCSESLLKVSSISGIIGPKTATPLPYRWCNDFVIQFLPIPEEVCTSVHRCSRIEFRTLSPAEYSNTIVNRN